MGAPAGRDLEHVEAEHMLEHDRRGQPGRLDIGPPFQSDPAAERKLGIDRSERYAPALPEPEKADVLAGAEGVRSVLPQIYRARPGAHAVSYAHDDVVGHHAVPGKRECGQKRALAVALVAEDDPRSAAVFERTCMEGIPTEPSSRDGHHRREIGMNEFGVAQRLRS